MAPTSLTPNQQKPTVGKSLAIEQRVFIAVVGLMIAWQSSNANAGKNVVILLADDLGWGDVGFHGGTANTPNLDRLAAEGVELNQFYAYPACSPARAAMLTGRFPHRYGIAGPVRVRDAGLPTEERLLAADFKAAGYATSLIGKWHLGGANEPGGHPNDRGLDHFYGFMDAAIDYFDHTNGRGQVDWQRNGKPVDEPGYATDLLTAEAVDRIQSRDQRKLFCMVVSFNAPHSPFQAPQELIAKYKDRLNERDAVYAAMIDSLDQGVGRILKTIDDEDLRDETIVVFASDNGAARMGTNAPFRGQKREVYEGGIHVPCVIRLPGVLEGGTKSEQPFAIHDLFPTLASAASVKLRGGQPLDGIDLWSRLTEGSRFDRTVVIAEDDHTIIRGDWKLIQPVDGSLELYNLKTDAAESTDLADSRSQVAADLLSHLIVFQQQVSNDEPASANTQTLVSETNADTVGSQEGEALASANLRGDAIYGVLGNRAVESNGSGVRLISGEDINGDGVIAGEVTLDSSQVSPDQRWYRFYISGLAQDNFHVDQDDLYLKVEFLQANGGSLDRIKERIYPQVVRQRDDFRDEATNESLGHGVWRTYAMDFRTPFAEVDSLKLSVGFGSGTGEGPRAEFWVNAMDVEPIDSPSSYRPANATTADFPQPDPSSLVSLGGRWYFDPQGGDRTLPKQFDYTNDDQLLYMSQVEGGQRFEAPFAGNMSSWLRAGYLDFNGDEVTEDVFKPYAVVITVTDTHVVVRSRNLPNHPTATFPDRWRMLDGNPSYIKEQANTHFIPFSPKVNPNAFAMDEKNSNQALPMGPIGVATNGVIFFNPFDHIFETDAVWRLDRCCGHPSPQQQYHYHKYPVCVKTPWSDEGQGHSNIIGFAFDGFPVYGPYESKGLLAKEDTKNPLNDFNLHEDNDRGPHYHVTPGQYPHIIGGYWGELDSMNSRRRRSGP